MKKLNFESGKTVKLRKKAISSGYSLFLEFTNNHKQEKIYLRMHQSKGNNPLLRNADAEMWNRADKIRQKVEGYIVDKIADTLEYAYKLYLEETNKEISEKDKKNKTLLAFLEEFKADKEKKGQSKSQATTINNLILYVKDFTQGENVLLKDVDKEWCEDFMYYLSKTNSFVRNRFKKGSNTEHIATEGEKSSKPLAKSTAKLYYNTFVSALWFAENKDLIINPAKKIKKDDKKPLKGEDSQREFLTIEELERMKETFVRNQETKRAFLFGCYVGLRVSDIKSLTYGDIKEEQTAKGKQIFVIRKMMIKTRKNVSVPLSNKALSYLPDNFTQHPKDERVFDLPGESSMNGMLKTWARDAGVNKVVTFHTSRHTFATLALTLGADIYTTSKLLGHQNVRTTQIYAEVIDAKKEEAISLFDTI